MGRPPPVRWSTRGASLLLRLLRLLHIYHLHLLRHACLAVVDRARMVQRSSGLGSTIFLTCARCQTGRRRRFGEAPCAPPMARSCGPTSRLHNTEIPRRKACRVHGSVPQAGVGWVAACLLSTSHYYRTGSARKVQTRRVSILDLVPHRHKHHMCVWCANVLRAYHAGSTKAPTGRFDCCSEAA